jgi:hypothetical protein
MPKTPAVTNSTKAIKQIITGIFDDFLLKSDI